MLVEYNTICVTVDFQVSHQYSHALCVKSCIVRDFEVNVKHNFLIILAELIGIQLISCKTVTPS